MTLLKAGEKLLLCKACGHQQIVLKKMGVILKSCSRCGNVRMKAVKARPTNIHGCGGNVKADLGLALLMEMGAGAFDENN